MVSIINQCTKVNNNHTNHTNHKRFFSSINLGNELFSTNKKRKIDNMLIDHQVCLFSKEEARNIIKQQITIDLPSNRDTFSQHDISQIIKNHNENNNNNNTSIDHKTQIDNLRNNFVIFEQALTQALEERNMVIQTLTKKHKELKRKTQELINIINK